MDGNDEVDAGSGVDWVSGGEGDDVLDGFTEADTLYGDADNDTLNGEDGNDTLRGGGQNDILNGGDEDDDLRCGRGTSDDANGGSHINGDAFLGAPANGGCEMFSDVPVVARSTTVGGTAPVPPTVASELPGEQSPSPRIRCETLSRSRCVVSLRRPVQRGRGLDGVATRKGCSRATTTSVMPMRTNGRRPSTAISAPLLSRPVDR